MEEGLSPLPSINRTLSSTNTPGVAGSSLLWHFFLSSSLPWALSMSQVGHAGETMSAAIAMSCRSQQIRSQDGVKDADDRPVPVWASSPSPTCTGPVPSLAIH